MPTGSNAWALPQVESAAWSSVIPTRGLRMSDATVDGYTMSPGETLSDYMTHVSADFFKTVGTRILSGGTFQDDVATGAPLTGIINETMAKKYFAGRGAIGGT